ncbi:transposase [Streptomyces sp. NPDC003247]|uniref:transposase n=1 Tax=Streptomyces sp. NPDC003247 TaxID=3364677 RepID=UPI0036BE6AA2
MSFDGCRSLRVPDSPRNRAWLGRTAHHGYPTLELMTLVGAGTRSLIGVVFGPTDEGETAYACRLLHLLRPDMLVLWDKGLDANAFLAQATATGAKVLGRLRSNRRTPVLARLDDGSYLSVIGTVSVRVIDAEVTVTCADGTAFTGFYRLVLLTYGDAVGVGGRHLLQRPGQVGPPGVQQPEVALEDRVVGHGRLVDAGGQFRPVGGAVVEGASPTDLAALAAAP